MATEQNRQPQRWAELSLPCKTFIIIFYTCLPIFAGYVAYKDDEDSPASKIADTLFKTFCVSALLYRLSQRGGDVTSQRVYCIILLLGIAWVAAMLISLGVYVANVSSMDHDSPPPEFFMDRANDKLIPLASLGSFPFVLHLKRGGLRRNWRQLPVFAVFMIWVLAEFGSWIVFAAGEDFAKPAALWTGIATTVVGTPLLAGSVFWCKSSLKRYDASMERAPLEGHACDDDDGGDKSRKCDDKVECEARSPLLPRGTPGHAEESC